MAWEVVIGLETHAQLTTASKIFSGSSTTFGAAPNVQASVIDLALPGTLPVLNRGAVERAIRFGLAVGATIASRSVFARKNYFYPDLPKGYQISQYEIPVVQGGSLTFVVQPKGGDAYVKTVRLTRAHLEEDAGKSLHEGIGSHAALGLGMSGIDLNRAGTPLLEIVTEPDIRVASVAGAAAEAVAYARALHSLVVWLGVCDGNMQEGSFRCDANVSVRRAGDGKLGTRCEIKNLNSFRFMQQAIEFEARRQIELIEDGGTVVQETRLYDPERDETRSMRSKEDAMDYRYFPDPDLLPLEIAPEWIERIRGELPELPATRFDRYKSQYLLTDYDASVLTGSRGLSDYFEETLSALAQIPGVPYLTQSPDVANGKTVANWITNDLSALLNRDGLHIEQTLVPPSKLASVIARMLDGTLNAKTARELFGQLWAAESERRFELKRQGVFELQGRFGEPAKLTVKGAVSMHGDIDSIIEARGLKQISDTGAIEKIVDEVLAANAKSVEEFRAGKEKAFNALVGQAMKATKGKANPQQVNDILRRRLAG
jgi:aspartyl-tRNA(Asn)/glutamyl-tRNA(Gln) amidotransferase subunit B